MNEQTEFALDFKKAGGLIPAIVQDDATGDVLMLAYMNEAALAATRLTGVVTFYSRSRQTLWIKGESSGHRLLLRQLLVDCDADAVVARVAPQGPGVCHNGYRSCFYRAMDGAGEVTAIAPQAFDPATVYGAGDAR